MKKAPFLFLLILLHSMTIHAQHQQRYTCRLIQAKELALFGTSNTVDFTCGYKAPYSKKQIAFVQVNQRNLEQFPEIQLRVRQLDCGSSGINYDMQKTLQASKYPSILLQPVRAFSDFSLSSQQQGEIQIWITIAGKKQLEKVSVELTPLGNDRFRIQGRHWLSFTRYGMDPPKALFGLVRVDDKLLLKFDLEIEIIPS